MIADYNKYDVEFSEGISWDIIAMSAGLLVGTSHGVLRSRNSLALSDPASKRNKSFVNIFDTLVESHDGPSEQLPDRVALEPGLVTHDVVPLRNQDPESPQAREALPVDCPGRGA